MVDRPLTDQEQRASDMLARYLDRWEAPAREAEGTARSVYWQAGDGWIISYTTTRVQGGPHDGKFVTRTLKPTGPGARSGQAETYEENYRRAFTTRRAAKARAVALYDQHDKGTSSE